ncbi:flagellar basal body P-ring formation chaperone FlgA [Pseudoalteromonas sp. R3]|uniref:flagellar basal body P-ring formation chaperone FlgA n=1 Tax=Pseudoalteromonas sp. R3 TaxID=1709477 RepID=UPI0006B5774A|nr:flagellar basal body P-ring formation chaperone FlgA [Pseudoalteromonas sp. R3]AZZ97384.1 flagellar basal body P-ring formation protein FlgA [Pseudoalteromonas sp. R3]
MSLLKITLSAYFFPIVAYFLATSFAYGQTYESKDIEKMAIDFISEQLPAPTQAEEQQQVSALPLDTRLPQRQCQRPLQVSSKSSPPFNRQVTVMVRCEDLESWVQFVHVKIETLLPVIVSTRMLDKGVLLTADDLTIEMRPKHFVRAANIDNMTLLIGSKTKRRIQQGKPISMFQICMICKGDNVTILASDGTLMIKTSGIALQDGNLGEQIRVKNARSGKTVLARVKDVDSVAVKI